jgi:hypothetical protein
MRLMIVLVSLGLLCLPVMVRAEIGVDGTDPAAIAPHENPGDPCGDCPDYVSSWGVTFKDGDLYYINRDADTIIQLDNESCDQLGTTAFYGIGLPCGLGYDHTRDLWIIDDPGADFMYVVDMNGSVVNSWPTTPAGNTGPVGCAYDVNRDVYWSCCWQTNRLYSFDPTTGAPVGVINCPAGTRISGLGYDAHNDVLVYHGRDQAYTYWVDAETGALLAQAPIPTGGGNNGAGAGVENGTQNCWLTHYETPSIFCVEGMGPSAVESATWGQIKDVFK